MFGKNKNAYEMVKFSKNDEYRVTMLASNMDCIVFVSNIETGAIVAGGKAFVTKDEADCEYNKQCFLYKMGEEIN